MELLDLDLDLDLEAERDLPLCGLVGVPLPDEALKRETVLERPFTVLPTESDSSLILKSMINA